MFEVFQKIEGQLRWLGQSPTERRARLLAIMLSRQQSSTVIVVENLASGTTAHRWTFKDGEMLPSTST